MLEPENLFEVGKFLIIGHLFYRGIPHVARLAPEWKHAERVAAYNAQTSNGQRFRRVSLRDNKRTLVGLVSTGPVGVIQLGDARDARLFGPICLLELFVNLCEAESEKIIQDSCRQDILDEFWFQINGISNF